MCSGRSTPCGCGCGGGAREAVGETWAGAGRVFDEVVYRDADANALLGGAGEWEVVARPGSPPPWHDGREALVIERALAEGRLARAHTARLDAGDLVRFVGPDGRMSANVLVLGRRAQAPARMPRSSGEMAEIPEAVDAPEREDAEDVLRRAGVFPPRDAAAIGGRAFMARIAGEKSPADWGAREEQMVQALIAGNMPDRLLRWITIPLSVGSGSSAITGSVQVLPDYLAVGSDSDYVYLPLDPISAQRVAEAFKVLLPTARICHAIYLQAPAKQRLAAIPRDYYLPSEKRRSGARGRDQDSSASYLEHSEAIQAKMTAAGIAFGELVAGHKKDVVIAKRLHATPDRVAFHGFYDDAGYPREPCYENPTGRPQPDCRKDNPTLTHHRRFSDYSQGVRLLHPTMIVNGTSRQVADVLADPALSALISSEGAIVPPRIPAPPAPARARAREAVDEAVPLGGRGAFRHDPLEGAAGDNVALRWNVDSAIAAGARVDVVVHLHGYGRSGDDFLTHKVTEAGIDLVDAGGTPRFARPTLAIVPRGRHVEGVQWVWDRLATRAALDQLIDAALAWLTSRALRGSAVTRGRLVLHAHSGGGAGLSSLLAAGVDPDEVVCFDSMYGGLDPIRQWALARLASGRAGASGLRVFYTPCWAPNPAHPAGRWIRGANGTWQYEPPGPWRFWASDRRWHLISTELNARRLAEAIAGPVKAGAAGLAARYRVERTSVLHGEIPGKYTVPLLASIAADLPATFVAPPATARPACVANDDWLTAPPRKPGGDAPPPASPEAGATRAS
jgi:hypothetical protein